MNQEQNQQISDSSQQRSTQKDPLKQDQQVWYLPKAMLLEELHSRRLVLTAMFIICCILFALVVWSGFAKVVESAVAFGEVMPVSDVKVIQHLEGGIIKSVLVKDGLHVKQGQLLMQLDPTATQSELKQSQSRVASLETDIARLRAFMKKHDMNDFKKAVVLAKNDVKNHQETEEDRVILQEEKQLLAMQSRAEQDQRAVIEAQIAQRQSDLERLLKEKAIMDKNALFLKQELEMHKQLIEQGYTSRLELIRAEKALNQARGDQMRAQEQVEQAQAALEEKKHSLKEMNSTLSKDTLKELGALTTELSQVKHLVSKLKDKLERMTIKASVDGIVKGVEVSPGSVVSPGGELLTLVPTAEDMQAVVRISTRDVGHVSLGDPVVVKVLAYDFARYGSITGELTRISASTFFDEKGAPYYEGIVSLNNQYVGSEDRGLRPGMTVQADITTGEKTVLQYILKPIYTTVTTSFGER